MRWRGGCGATLGCTRRRWSRSPATGEKRTGLVAQRQDLTGISSSPLTPERWPRYSPATGEGGDPANQVVLLRSGEAESEHVVVVVHHVQQRAEAAVVVEPAPVVRSHRDTVLTREDACQRGRAVAVVRRPVRLEVFDCSKTR